jgi:hypothetical protein
MSVDELGDSAGAGRILIFDFASPSSVPVEVLGDDVFLREIAGEAVKAAVAIMASCRPGDLFRSRVGFDPPDQDDQQMYGTSRRSDNVVSGARV